jgi:hypothetical protein
LFQRYSLGKVFKVGSTERMIYEKVAGLRKVNMMHSILYSFCSEGSFPEALDQGLVSGVGLIGPTIDQSISHIANNLT